MLDIALLIIATSVEGQGLFSRFQNSAPKSKQSHTFKPFSQTSLQPSSNQFPAFQERNPQMFHSKDQHFLVEAFEREPSPSPSFDKGFVLHPRPFSIIQTSESSFIKPAQLSFPQNTEQSSTGKLFT